MFYIYKEGMDSTVTRAQILKLIIDASKEVWYDKFQCTLNYDTDSFRINCYGVMKARVILSDPTAWTELDMLWKIVLFDWWLWEALEDYLPMTYSALVDIPGNKIINLKRFESMMTNLAIIPMWTVAGAFISWNKELFYESK